MELHVPGDGDGAGGMSKIHERVNKIKALIRWLQPKAISDRVRRAQANAAERGFMMILEAVRKTQPVHQDDDPIIELGGSFPWRDPRPSTRRGYVPIEQGWVLNNAHDAQGIRLRSRSQHLQYQRFGTMKKNYPIPIRAGGNMLLFWWGSPLPWAPTRPPMLERAPGPFFMPQIIHPGLEPYGGSDFVQRAVDQVMPDLRWEWLWRLRAVTRSILHL